MCLCNLSIYRERPRRIFANRLFVNFINFLEDKDGDSRKIFTNCPFNLDDGLKKIWEKKISKSTGLLWADLLTLGKKDVADPISRGQKAQIKGCIFPIEGWLHPNRGVAVYQPEGDGF